MRIERLTLGRYGHLADLSLTFPGARGLHVVLGANEAGKSTALAAIGDALFGFPHRSEFAFLHDAKDLRIALAVRARDGRDGVFTRLKRRRDDLLDSEDQPLPESALAAFLGGATRERFRQVFGLDAGELRRGGAAILEGRGEVGESLLRAQTGMGGFRTLAERLSREAGQLFGDRRGQRAFHVAADAFAAARKSLDSRGIEPAAYRKQREEEQHLLQATADDAGEAGALRTERVRLERIHRTAPALAARARMLAERADMGEVAALPAGAETDRQAAILARDRAAHDLRREQARDEHLARDLAGLAIDAALLAEGDAIDALAAEQNRILATRRDREAQRAIAGERRRDVEAAGRRLGRATDAATLVAGGPDALARGRARRATEAHTRLSTRLGAAREACDAAARQRAEAEAALADHPQAAPFAALRAAIDAARAEGRIDDEVRQAAAALDTAGAEAARALAALPLWSGTGSALADAPVPLEAMVLAEAERLHAAETALRTAREQREAVERILREIAAELRGAAATGDLPTADAIAEARARRDRAWRLLRRHRLEGGPAPTEAELDGLPAAALSDALEDAIRAADTLADRRASDGERVVAFEQARRRAAQQQAVRETLLAAEAESEAGCVAARAAWRALWQPAGVAAGDPAAMRDWMRQRGDAIAAHDRAEGARRGLAVARARHAAAWSSLAALLPEAVAPASCHLADLLRAATLECAARERAEAALAEARSRALAAREAAETAARALAGVEAELGAWRESWAPVAAALGLSGVATAEDGTLALEVWDEIERIAKDWRAAEARVAEMTGAIDEHVAGVAALAGRLAPDLADADADDALRQLAARLATTRAAAEERARKLAEQRTARQALAQAAEAHAAAAATLAGLRTLAGVADDDALPGAIARAAHAAALSARIAERDAELAREDRAPADLEADAAGTDLDALPARLARIDERLREIADAAAARAGRLTELRAALREMEQGHDAAGAAREMHDALADAEEAAARYVRLRLAHTLLSAGIDRFRRDQQGPLLARAGALFARLTEGRYDRLGIAEAGEDDMAIVALRPDGSDCPADRLSEGTRDQLYLALRLAAIEGDAARTEPLPFIADDLLVNFDDGRARAALRVLAEFGAVTQTILFTHHAHIAEMADPEWASLHRLPAPDGFPAPAIPLR